MDFGRSSEDQETRALRERVLARALEEFCEHGLQAARVERIARLTRMSTATLYRLYPGKEGLFAAALNHGLSAFTSWQTSATDDPLVDLALTARGYAAALENPAARKVARILFGEMRPRAPRLMALGGALRSTLEGKFERPLTRCAEVGVLDLSRPRPVVALLLGTIEHQCLMHGLLMGDDDYSVFRGADVADHAVRAVIAVHGAPGVVFPLEAVNGFDRASAGGAVLRRAGALPKGDGFG